MKVLCMYKEEKEVEVVTNPGEGFCGIEERQLVLADALDVLNAQRKVIHGFEAELLLQRVEDVRYGRCRVVFERLGLSILQIDFHHVGHQRRSGRLCYTATSHIRSHVCR